MSRPFGKGPKALRIRAVHRRRLAAARADAARRAQLDPEAPPVKMSRTRAAREQPHG